MMTLDRETLRAIVDKTWNEATESTEVPSTQWSDEIIDAVLTSREAKGNSIQQQAEAWLSICALLDMVTPGWASKAPDPGVTLALRYIAEMAAGPRYLNIECNDLAEKLGKSTVKAAQMKIRIEWLEKNFVHASPLKSGGFSYSPMIAPAIRGEDFASAVDAAAASILERNKRREKQDND